MVKVYLETVSEEARLAPSEEQRFYHSLHDYHLVRRSAGACPSPIHELVSDPKIADLILFTDSQSLTLADVRIHPLANRFPEKVFVFSSQDHVIPLLPGIYTCTEQRWFVSQMRAGFYIQVIDRDFIQP